MNEEILINSTPNETRVALVENGVLQEVFMERNRNGSIVGNIYIGRVEKILPGLQAAFVNIGMSRSAFMHVTDICSQKKIARIDGIDDEAISEQNNFQPISKIIHEGQRVVLTLSEIKSRTTRTGKSNS